MFAGSKTDAADAGAVCGVVGRLSMRFVPVKSINELLVRSADAISTAAGMWLAEQDKAFGPDSKCFTRARTLLRSGSEGVR
jgi:hypothetical protein